MTHSWCRDIQRDESVRAAEDGRQGPLPTLEECISRAGQFVPSEPPQERKCTERESGMRTERVTLEITHSSSIHPAQWDWRYITDDQVYDFECVRVVEEVAIDAAWAERLTAERDAAIRERDEAKELAQGLVVGFVPPATISDLVQERDQLRSRVAELEQLSRQRAAATLARVDELEHRGRESYSRGWNAAIMREREAEKSSRQQQAMEETALESAPDASEWRMLTLGEIVKDGDEYLQSDGRWLTVALRHKIREQDVGRFRRRVSAPAASGAANSSGSPKSSEPDAWGVMRNGEVDAVTYLLRSSAELAAEGWGGTVVPLYTSPPPARGWLTEEERGIIELARNHFYETCEHPDDLEVVTLDALLARSSPPEVVRPKRWSDMRSVIADQRDADWLAALAAAGVKVKEVGE